MSLHEGLRYIHEDVERLEQAIADRVLAEPKHIRSRLIRDHEVATFLARIQSQSQRALHVYNDDQEARTAEIQSLSTGDPFEEFYRQLEGLKTFHKKYPNEPIENLERAYKRVEDGGPGDFAGDIDGMFTGEESFGRFFDLTMLHEEYLNLPGIKGSRKITYLQYLDIFDSFTPPQCPISRQDKMTDQYFAYVGSLAQYLESFMRKVKPLEDLDRLFEAFDKEFVGLWDSDKVSGWEKQTVQKNGVLSREPVTEGTGEGVWCADCEKEFKNDNVYKAHLAGKKHVNNAKSRQKHGLDGDMEMANHSTNGISAPITGYRLKERVVAEREHQIRKLVNAMKTEREDTRVNVERKAGMTDRERQQELAALYAEDEAAAAAAAAGRLNGEKEDGEDDEKQKDYNPLKLPLAWDGKPIPFWLYKLHGLGVEFTCEICGKYTYMGRRAFEKHFSEARHIYGLKCLGVTNTSMFREITGIEEAQKLWEKIQRDRRKVKEKGEGVIEMEDPEGNVMPEKVYNDLVKQGII